MSDFVADLSEQQRRVVQHDHGPLLVMAGPGSGKTRVITGRIAYRVMHRAAPPDRILAITFTNRAADEMQHRLRDLLGDDARVPIGTFHWMCSALLRRYGRRLGFARDFRLLSPAEARNVLRAVTPSGGSAAAFSRAVSAIKNGASAVDTSRLLGVPREELLRVRDAYDRLLRSSIALDLDDLLVQTASLLRSQPDVWESARARFDEILIDEFQDTNPVQIEIVQLLAPRSRSVIAVGDDDQAIYEWRQAGGGAQLFAHAFPDAETVVLGDSYRHSKRILRVASTLIENNTRRTSKVLHTQRAAGQRPVSFVARDELEEAEWIAERIEEAAREGIRLAEIGVLYRVHAQSRAIEDALVRHNLPYRIMAGRRFYELPEIQRVLAYLRLALDSDDDQATAVLAHGVRGVGTTRLEHLQEFARHEKVHLLDALEQSDSVPGIPTRVRHGLQMAASRARRVAEARALALSVVAGRAIEAVRADLETSASDMEAVGENLDELSTVVREFEVQRGTLRGLIDRLTVQWDAQGGSQGVSLLSLHAAKGLEFSVVFLPGLEEGLLPHRRSLDREEDIESERRLAYVGVTRARDRLFLSHAHIRLLGGQALVGGASRFLREMGPANMTIELSERSAAHPRLPSVRAGERVEHSRWGEGTVLSSEGHGRDTLTTIAFDSVGRQRLQLCHAPLRRLSSVPNEKHVG